MPILRKLNFKQKGNKFWDLLKCISKKKLLTPSKKAEKATYRPFPNVAAGAFTRSIGGDMSTPMLPNPISHVLSRHIQIDWLSFQSHTCHAFCPISPNFFNALQPTFLPIFTFFFFYNESVARYIL